MSTYSKYVESRREGWNHQDSCILAGFRSEFILPSFPSAEEVNEEIEKIVPKKDYGNLKWHDVYGLLRHKLPYPPVVAQVIFLSIERSLVSTFSPNGECSCHPVAHFDKCKYAKTMNALVTKNE